MKRKIIEIDEERCVGCGNCIPDCKQGALQIIDGKARLISDLMCEGIGACVGSCPQGAMQVISKEAAPYDEKTVMKRISAGGAHLIKAHLDHLLEHGQKGYHQEALEYLQENNIPIPEERQETPPKSSFSCPGTRVHSHERTKASSEASALGQWPVQLKLIPPTAPFLQGADLLLASDCSPTAAGDFHSRFLQGKALAIACPKLDSGTDEYIESLSLMIDQAGLNTINVLIMEVPCCAGLLEIAKEAARRAERKVPIKAMILSISGEMKSEHWL